MVFPPVSFSLYGLFTSWSQQRVSLLHSYSDSVFILLYSAHLTLFFCSSSCKVNCDRFKDGRSINRRSRKSKRGLCPVRCLSAHCFIFTALVTPCHPSSSVKCYKLIIHCILLSLLSLFHQTALPCVASACLYSVFHSVNQPTVCYITHEQLPGMLSTVVHSQPVILSGTVSR